jgi:hypothetical protein
MPGPKKKKAKSKAAAPPAADDLLNMNLEDIVGMAMNVPGMREMLAASAKAEAEDEKRRAI